MTVEHDAPRSTSRGFGLIGGLGPPATVHYYKALLKAFAERNATARLLIAHTDMAHALGLVAIGDRVGLARYLAGFVGSLALAGAEFVAVSAVTPHLCIRELREASPVPLVDIVEALIQELDLRKVERLALLGTRFTMEQRLFGRLERFDLIELAPDAMAQVHRIYMSIAANGAATPTDLDYLKDVGRRLHDAGAQVVVAAGTELSLVLHERQEEFPLLDCAKAHITAITRLATA